MTHPLVAKAHETDTFAGMTVDSFTRMPVAARLINVLDGLPAISKTGRAPQQMGGYSFRSIEDMTAALKPLFAQHGVLVLPQVIERRDSTREMRSGSVLNVTALLIQFTFYGADGDSIVASVWGEGTDSGDKATQKAITAGFKSMLSVTFCVSDQELDSERHVTDPVRKPPDGFDSHEEARAAHERVRHAVEQAGLTQWVREQDFAWPWTKAACVTIGERAAAVLAQDKVEQPEII